MKDIISKTFTSEKGTLEFAKTLGAKLRGGETIELIGDIGSGKTTFVKGLASGAGSKDHVTSPTFVIQQKYAGRLTIYHYDFYRLSDAGLMAHEIQETATDKNAVVVVEWADTVKDVLPDRRLQIEIKLKGETARQLDISIPADLGYLK